MKFTDLFSSQSDFYAKYRPSYPEQLYRDLAELAPCRSLVWDCATGNGQAAACLARYFDRVEATDGSAEQVSRAKPHPKVHYRQALAADSGLEAGSVSLVTVATAVHWFEMEPFYAEVKRVLRPGGVIGVWTYQAHVSINPELDEIIAHYSDVTLAEHWGEGMKWVRESYETLPFPFQPLPAADYAAEADWTFEQLLGNLRSWSASRTVLEKTGQDPVAELEAPLRRAWGQAEKRRLRWPLHARFGRV